MPERTNNLAPENVSTLDRLVRSIDLAEGFALFFARCNAPALRGELILAATEQLAALGVDVVEVAFEDESANVRERLRAALAAADKDTKTLIPVEMPAPFQPLAVAEPPAGYTVGGKRTVFVTGLECGIPYDQPNARVLAELNLGRDAFPRDVPYPLVIWLPDYAVTAVARFAPDFWAWRSGVFEFETDETDRRTAFEQSIWRDQPLHALTNLTPEDRLLRRRQLESLLDDYRDLPDDAHITRERAYILTDLGNVCAAAQDYGAALVYYQQALALQSLVGARGAEGVTLNNLGLIYSNLGDRRKALEHYEQSLPLLRQVGNRSGEAAALNNIGRVYDDLGEKHKALGYHEQALQIVREVADRGGEATTLNNMGRVYADLGEKRKALNYYEQASPIYRQMRDRDSEAMTLNNIGLVYADLGDRRRAVYYYEQALLIARQVGNRHGEAATLNNIAGVYSALGDKRKALGYYEQAVEILHQLGDCWHESMGRSNIALVYEELNDLAKAEEQLQIVVTLDETVGRPDLASDRTALERIRAKRTAGTGKI